MCGHACTLDSEKLENQIESCFVSFVKPDELLDVMFQFRATSNTLQRFNVDMDLNYNTIFV